MTPSAVTECSALTDGVTTTEASFNCRKPTSKVIFAVAFAVTDDFNVTDPLPVKGASGLPNSPFTVFLNVIDLLNTSAEASANGWAMSGFVAVGAASGSTTTSGSGMNSDLTGVPLTSSSPPVETTASGRVAGLVLTRVFPPGVPHYLDHTDQQPVRGTGGDTGDQHVIGFDLQRLIRGKDHRVRGYQRCFQLGWFQDLDVGGATVTVPAAGFPPGSAGAFWPAYRYRNAAIASRAIPFNGRYSRTPVTDIPAGGNARRRQPGDLRIEPATSRNIHERRHRRGP